MTEIVFGEDCRKSTIPTEDFASVLPLLSPVTVFPETSLIALEEIPRTGYFSVSWFFSKHDNIRELAHPPSPLKTCFVPG